LALSPPGRYRRPLQRGKPHRKVRHQRKIAGGSAFGCERGEAQRQGNPEFDDDSGNDFGFDAIAVDSRKAIAGNNQTTPVGGLFIPNLNLGDPVEFGQKLVTLQDELGDILYVLRAGRTGILAGLPHVPLLQINHRAA
jgi:hypothetical protein